MTSAPLRGQQICVADQDYGLGVDHRDERQPDEHQQPEQMLTAMPAKRRYRYLARATVARERTAEENRLTEGSGADRKRAFAKSTRTPRPYVPLLQW